MLNIWKDIWDLRIQDNNNLWFFKWPQGRVLTKSEFSLNSSYNFWCLRVDTLPLPCMIFLRAWVISAFRFLAAPLSPVVRMVMSIFPVDGSTAACFRASLYNLYQTRPIIRNRQCKILRPLYVSNKHHYNQCVVHHFKIANLELAVTTFIRCKTFIRVQLVWTLMITLDFHSQTSTSTLCLEDHNNLKFLVLLQRCFFKNKIVNYITYIWKRVDSGNIHYL